MAEPFLVLIPVNQLDRAKGRLATLLFPDERRALFLATFRTVIDAARGATDLVVILTPDPKVAAEVSDRAQVLEEDPEIYGLNPQLTSALARIEAPAGGVLILHSDLPLATADAILAVVAAAPAEPSATLVRSRDGGTNAMLLRPPGRFQLTYGTGSFGRHSASARTAGLEVVECREPALELDLDTPADLEALLAMPRGRDTPAGEIVASLDIGRRQSIS